MRKELLVLGLIGVISTGCATRGYVRQSVQQVEQRVEDAELRTTQKIEMLNVGLAQQQDRLEGTREQVTRVDAKTGEAQRRADEAQSTARAAHEASRHLESSLATLTRVVVLDDRVQMFAHNSARLTPEAEIALGAFVASIREQDRGVVWIEIEGHTDNVGAAPYNHQLSLRRAEAVRVFLATQQIPLHKISVIGYGASRPIAPNRHRSGRAQNRRVVIRVVR